MTTKSLLLFVFVLIFFQVSLIAQDTTPGEALLEQADLADNNGDPEAPTLFEDAAELLLKEGNYEKSRLALERAMVGYSYVQREMDVNRVGEQLAQITNQHFDTEEGNIRRQVQQAITLSYLGKNKESNAVLSAIKQKVVSLDYEYEDKEEAYERKAHLLSIWVENVSRIGTPKEIVKSAEEIKREVLDQEEHYGFSQLASSYSAYASAMYFAEYIGEAIYGFKQVINLVKKKFDNPNHPNIVAMENNLSACYSYLGMEREANLLKRKNLPYTYDHYKWNAYHSLAGNLSNYHRFDEAQQFFNKSLDEKYYPQQPSNQLLLKSNYLIFLTHRKDTIQGKQIVKDGEEIVKNNNLSELDKAYFWDKAGMFYTQIGAFEKAKNALDQSREIYEDLETDGSNQISIAELERRYAAYYQKLRNYDKAEAYYRRAMAKKNAITKLNSLSNESGLLEMYEESNQLKKKGALVDSVLNSNKIDPLNPMLPIFYLEKAKLLQSQNQQHKALEYCMDGIHHVEKILFDLKENTDVFSHYDNYEELFTLGLFLSNELNDHEATFYFMEMSKNFIIKKNLLQSLAVEYSGIPKEYSDSLRLLAQSEQFYSDLKSKENLNEEEKDLYEDKLSEVENKKSLLLSKIQKEYPKYNNFFIENSTTTLQHVQNKLLNKNRSFVSFGLTSDSTLYTLVVNKNGIFNLRKPLDYYLADEIERLNQAIQRDDFTTYLSVASTLYQDIYKPIAEELKDNVIVVRDGPLHYLNFETLFLPNKANNFNELDYLLYHKQFSYLLSASHELLLKSFESTAKEEIGVYVPGFQSSQTTYEVDLSSQPFSLALGKQLAQKNGVSAFLAEEATKDNFFTQAGNFGLVHLASHAIIDETYPYQSKIFMSPSDSLTSNTIQLAELYHCPINADLVVLLGCETGKGKIENGEGVLSFSHALSYSGSNSQIFTTLKVDEETSNQILSNFYDLYNKGKAKQEAIREAKIQFLNTQKDPKLSNPYYWGAITMIGVDANTTSIMKWVWLAAILALIIFFFVWLRRK